MEETNPNRAALFGAAAVLLAAALLLAEYAIPNAVRWTTFTPDSHDYLPVRLSAASITEDSIGSYLFAYHRVLIAAMTAAICLLIIAIGLRRVLCSAQRKVEGADLSRNDEKRDEIDRQRAAIARLSWWRDSVVEPIAGAVTIALVAWLANVILVAKGDVEWFRTLLPSPWHVTRQLQVHAGDFTDAMLRSGGHLAIAAILGTVLGIVTGYVLSRLPWLHRSTAIHITIVAGLPPILLSEIFAKIAVLRPVEFLLGSETAANRIGILMATWAVTWPTLTATTLALRSIEPEFRRSIRILGARTPFQWMHHVELPVVGPAVLSNLRVGIAIGLIVLLYGEGRGGSPDHKTLGVWLSEIGSEFPLPKIFALLVFTSAVFVGLEAALRIVELIVGRRSRSRAMVHKQSALSETTERRQALEQFENARDRWLHDNAKVFERAGAALIRVETVTKTYAGQVAFSNADDTPLEFKAGRISSIIGRSGAGKSTLLKLMLGFARPDTGRNGITVAGHAIGAAADRWIDDHACYVSQKPTLLQHKNVLGNLLFGVRQEIRRSGGGGGLVAEVEYAKWLLGYAGDRPNPDIAKTPLGLLIRFFGLQEKLDRRPSELSGGEAQRVHLLRWLMLPRPVLIMDEAFSALDQPLKGMLRDAIVRHAQRFKIAMINVSHDRADVLQMSHQIVFVNRGRVEAVGTPDALYRNPTSRDLAIFLGHTNLFMVNAAREDALSVTRDFYRGVDFGGGGARIPVAKAPLGTRDDTIIFIPVNAVSVSKPEGSSADEVFRVEELRFLGTHYEARLSRDLSDVDSRTLRLEVALAEADRRVLFPSGTEENVTGRTVAVKPSEITIINERRP